MTVNYIHAQACANDFGLDYNKFCSALRKYVAVAALPGGGVELSDAQCDSIYDALDVWAQDVDAYEFGLPHYAGGGKETGREIIRKALSPTPNPREAEQ